MEIILFLHDKMILLFIGILLLVNQLFFMFTALRHHYPSVPTIPTDPEEMSDAEIETAMRTYVVKHREVFLKRYRCFEKSLWFGIAALIVFMANIINGQAAIMHRHEISMRRIKENR